MSKEIWIAAFEELIEKYLNEHPDATEKEAYAAAAVAIDRRYADKLADMIDYARLITKEKGIF